jgi:hypothetical protein
MRWFRFTTITRRADAVPLAGLYCGLVLAVALLQVGRAAAQQANAWAQGLNQANKDQVDRTWDTLTENCKKEVLEEEGKALDRKLAMLDVNPGAAAQVPVPHPEEFARQQFEGPNKKRLKALEDAQSRIDRERDDAERDWREAMATVLRFRQHREAEGWLTDATASIVDGDTVLIVLGGFALVLISILLGMHERRRQLRSRLRFHGRMGMAGVVATATACFLVVSLSSCARRGADDAANRTSQEQRALDDLRVQVTEVQRDVDGKWKKLLDAERIAAPFDEFKKKFQAGEQEAHQKARQLALSSLIRAQALAQTRENLKKLEDERAEVARAIDDGTVRRWWRAGIKIGLCFVFLLAAFVPLSWARRRNRRELKGQSRQCPRCLAVHDDGLKIIATGAKDERFPEPVHVECQECGYEFRGSYLNLPRFCFPTVGVPSSGKTHWLATAYDLIKNDKVPASASLQRAPSLMDDQFDVEAELILEHHRGARATVHSTEFPSPLIFRIEDRDRLQHNAGMLNLFDFSGEMMKQHVNSDMLRRRALLMDGFVLFLDPTKVRVSKGGDSIKNQVQALTAFHQEIRDMRQLDVGAPVPVPVAVCISKLDLITTQNPFSSAALPWLAELRQSFARPTSLAEIKRRSKLCEEKLPLLFPGWNLSRTLEENFGGRFLFFPLTPVSLVENELGRTDLSRRTPAPVGILEPILWLLYMHGFDVLA